jgi:hypothetical protein
VPAVASLTPSIGPQGDSPSPLDQSCNHDGNSQYPPSVRALLGQARQGLFDAEYAAHTVERYAQTYLAALRAAAEAGVHYLVTSRDADDMVRHTGQFVILMRRSLTRAFR